MIHRTRIDIRWGDMDAFSHLNNVAFFRLMEEARIQWCHEAGIELDNQGEGVVVVNVSCDFLQQVRYPANIEVQSDVVSLGRSSIDLRQRLEVIGSEAGPCAQGHSRIVWIDFREGRSRPLPEKLRRKLQSFVAET